MRGLPGGTPGSRPVHPGIPGSPVVRLGIPGSSPVHLGIQGSCPVHSGIQGARSVHLRIPGSPAVHPGAVFAPRRTGPEPRIAGRIESEPGIVHWALDGWNPNPGCLAAAHGGAGEGRCVVSRSVCRCGPATRADDADRLGEDRADALSDQVQAALDLAAAILLHLGTCRSYRVCTGCLSCCIGVNMGIGTGVLSRACGVARARRAGICCIFGFRAVISAGGGSCSRRVCGSRGVGGCTRTSACVDASICVNRLISHACACRRGLRAGTCCASRHTGTC